MKNLILLAVRGAMALSVCIATAHAADSCPLEPTSPAPGVDASVATSAAEYRIAAARHIYASYASCVMHGKLPPLIHGIVLIELAVGKDGGIHHLNFVRVPPEMPNAAELVSRMIQRIAPFPAALDAGSEELAFNEVWMFDEQGRFQLGALTEGPL